MQSIQNSNNKLQ